LSGLSAGALGLVIGLIAGVLISVEAYKSLSASALNNASAGKMAISAARAPEPVDVQADLAPAQAEPADCSAFLAQSLEPIKNFERLAR
jgi:hypothetical protein